LAEDDSAERKPSPRWQSSRNDHFPQEVYFKWTSVETVLWRAVRLADYSPWCVLQNDPQCACILGDEEMAKKASASNDIKLVPLGDRVVVKRAEAESKTAGGIVLPDAAKDKPQRGEVLAVGEGHTKSNGMKAALTVKAGDQVIFSSYAGDELKVGDENYLLMRESDILAIIG